MFSLSPIPPTGPSRLASPPVKGDDWCGTKPPGATVPVAQTPDRNPLARTLGHVTDGYVAMLDAYSALNPVASMIFEPGARPVAPDFTAAISGSERGMAAINDALVSYGRVRDDVATALESAAREARAGHQALTTEHNFDVMPNVPHISQQFDAAATWLDVAGNLLALKLGKPGFEPFATR